jgi:heme a synthase
VGGEPKVATGVRAGIGRGPTTRSRRRALRVWFWSGAALTFLILVIGGITRLTQSGLSIVDWEPIMGVVPPLNEAQWQDAFDRYRAVPRVPAAAARHDALRVPVHLLLGVPAPVGGAADRPRVPRAVRVLLAARVPRPPLVATLAAAVRAGRHAGVHGLVHGDERPGRPARVSHYRLAAHLVLAFSIFGLATYYALSLREPRGGARLPAAARTAAGWSLGVVAALFALQVVWGAFVAGLKAGFMFPTFPLMGGAWIPPGFLMLEPPLVNLIENPITVQWVHRVLGTVLLLAALGAYLRARRVREDPASRRFGAALLALVAAQYLLGVLTVVYYVPIALAVGHQAMALVLFGVLLAWLHHLRHAPTSAE